MKYGKDLTSKFEYQLRKKYTLVEEEEEEGNKFSYNI